MGTPFNHFFMSNMLIGYFFDSRLLISTEYSSFLLLQTHNAIYEDFWLPKNIRPKISALTVRPRKKNEFAPQPSSIFSLWPGHSKQAQKYHYQKVQLGCVIFETPKYESGTEGKYYPIPIQEIRRSPFRSLVRRSGLVTRKWVSRETSQRFPWGTR